MEELNVKTFEPSQQSNQAKDSSSSTPVPKGESKESKLQSKPSTSSTAEQDLDVFLLGDLGSSDEGPGTQKTILFLYFLSLLFFHAVS